MGDGAIARHGLRGLRHRRLDRSPTGSGLAGNPVPCRRTRSPLSRRPLHVARCRQPSVGAREPGRPRVPRVRGADPACRTGGIPRALPSRDAARGLGGRGARHCFPVGDRVPGASTGGRRQLGVDRDRGLRLPRCGAVRLLRRARPVGSEQGAPVAVRDPHHLWRGDDGVRLAVGAGDVRSPAASR